MIVLVGILSGSYIWGKTKTYSQYMYRSNRILFPPCKNPVYWISPRIFRWGRNCWKGKIRQEDLKGQEALPWEGLWNKERFVAVEKYYLKTSKTKEPFFVKDPNLQIGYIGEVRGDVPPIYLMVNHITRISLLALSKIGLQKFNSFSDGG